MIRIGKDSIIIVSLFFICFFGFYNFHINIYTMCLLALIFTFFIKKQKISKETLYLIFDYPYKYYTFKHFEV